MAPTNIWLFATSLACFAASGWSFAPSFTISQPLRHRHDLKVRFSHQPHVLPTTTTLRQSSGDVTSIAKPKRRWVPSSAPAAVSAAAFVVLDMFFRRLFRLLGITFPSSLAGCGVLFASLLALEQRQKTEDPTLYKVLQPGAALLAKWLPVFFVPSLVTLPLSGGFGSAAEVLKVSSVIAGGFFFSLLTTAMSVVLVRKLLSSQSNASSETEEGKAVEQPIVLKDESSASDSESGGSKSDNKETQKESAISISAASPPSTPISNKKGPYSDRLFYVLASLSGLSGVTTTLTYLAGLRSYSNPLTTVFFLCTTLGSFVYGTRLPKAFTKWVHPLITCTTLTWTALSAFGIVTGRSLKQLLRLYRTGKLNAPGAGDLLLFCLGPAVVSLAISMYERRRLMRDNLPEVGTAIGVSTVGGLFGTALAVRWLEIGDPTVRLALLSRNITSPLAMAMASILGADASLAVSIVVVTGLIGANFGASVLSALGIKDAVARGLGMGAAAHGLGTAAIVEEKDAFPFSAIAMALTASAATVTVSIPLFRRLILQMALGW